MKINPNDFRVRPGEMVRLGDWPTVVKPICKSKKRYQELLEEHVKELSALQQLHYASSRYALLLIFQGIDAAGKDGAIRHVMNATSKCERPVCNCLTADGEKLRRLCRYRRPFGPNMPASLPRLLERSTVAIIDEPLHMSARVLASLGGISFIKTRGDTVRP
jgi:hypothetical protein